jgi:hypothetical protein
MQQVTRLTTLAQALAARHELDAAIALRGAADGHAGSAEQRDGAPKRCRAAQRRREPIVHEALDQVAAARQAVSVWRAVLALV